MKTIIILFAFCFYFLNLQSQVDSLPIAPIEEAEPDPKAFASYDREPEPLNINEVAKKIVYPQEAKDLSITGKVIVRVLVSEKGTYLKHIVMRTPHEILTKEVERHIQDIKYKPGILNGKTVKVWVTIPFSFNLTDDDEKTETLEKAYQWNLHWKIIKQDIDNEFEITFYYIKGTTFLALSMCSKFKQNPSDAEQLIKEIGGKIIKKNGDDFIFENSKENKIGRLIFPEGYPCFLIIQSEDKLNKNIKNQMIKMIENKEIIKNNHQKI